eukprot:COSAG01_NODE_302_length_19206_cov_11.098687_7_plen_176_part_00
MRSASGERGGGALSRGVAAAAAAAAICHREGNHCKELLTYDRVKVKFHHVTKEVCGALCANCPECLRSAEVKKPRAGGMPIITQGTNMRGQVCAKHERTVSQHNAPAPRAHRARTASHICHTNTVHHAGDNSTYATPTLDSSHPDFAEAKAIARQSGPCDKSMEKYSASWGVFVI